MKKLIFPMFIVLGFMSCKENDGDALNHVNRSQRTKNQDASPGDSSCTSCEAYHPVNTDGVWVDLMLNGHSYKAFDVDNRYIVEGDIMVKKPQVQARSTITTIDTELWPNNTLYYRWAANLPQNQKDIFTAAVAEWEKQVPDLNLVYDEDATDYVEVNKGDGCSSYIGKTGGKQTLNIGNGCFAGQAIHEIGHALGLFHEQTRPDRDNYVIIHEENISEGHEHNFDKCSDCETVGDFDFGSIMMYGGYDFSSNGEPTITKLDGSDYEKQRKSLSAADIVGIKTLYDIN